MKKFDYPLFTLSEKLTDAQQEFFNENGFLHFKKFISQETIAQVISEMQRIEKKWIAEDVEFVNGVPIKYGMDINKNKIVQRFAFSSLHSEILHNFLQDNRFKALIPLLNSDQGRIGEHEKDGMVINHYINTGQSNYSQLGWHTDALRDIFYGKKIKPMLNVGVHLDTTYSKNGGLRILPKTHRQNIFNFLCRKIYFLDKRPDPNEVGLDIEAGDLTIHDGRMWHRVALSRFEGEKSRRRVIYVPIICDKYEPKNKDTKTPFYHRFQKLTN